MIPFAGLLLAASLAASPPRALPASSPSPPVVDRTILERRVDALPDTKFIAAADPRPLFNARRQRAAKRYRFERRMLLLASIVFPALVLFRLWGSGAAARLRYTVTRVVAPPAAPFAFSVVLITIGWLAAFPLSFVDYRLNRLYGLTRLAPAAWLGTWIVQAAIAALLLALVAAGILWLVERTRVWYLYASAALVAATLALAWIDPVLFSPLVSTDRPLPRHSLPFLTQSQVARSPLVVPLFVGDVPRTGLAAGVSGLANTTRIVIGDYVVASASAREKSYIILRETGHVATADPFRNALVFAGFGIVTLGLAVALADRVAFRPDDDPLSRLALVTASALVFSIVVWLPVAHYLRGREASADRYAVRLTGDRAAAVRSIVRTSDELLLPMCPSFDWTFPDIHEPPGDRIAAILDQPDYCRKSTLSSGR